VVDPVDLHVSDAGATHQVTAVLGDARALPFAADSVDAVLLLGPLYHLVEAADRERAWREAARVVRPGGPVVAATISRFASLFDGLSKGTFDDDRFGPMIDRALTDGVHRNDHQVEAWFTTAFFHHPDQLGHEPANAGLTVDRVVAVETPLWTHDPRVDEYLADPRRAARLLAILRRIEDEPSLLGASSHQLTIARKPARS
jgi:SAM-dependent methyltransferase